MLLHFFLHANNTGSEPFVTVTTTALHLVNLFSRCLREIRSVLPKELSWPWAGFLYDLRYILPVNRCGTTHLGSRACSLLVLCARLLLFLVHSQGIAMMRTLGGGICQCIKYVERHLKCNYTDREKGEHGSEVLVGGKRVRNCFSHCTTFYSLWQSRTTRVPLFLGL